MNDDLVGRAESTHTNCTILGVSTQPSVSAEA